MNLAKGTAAEEVNTEKIVAEEVPAETEALDEVDNKAPIMILRSWIFRLMLMLQRLGPPVGSL